MKCGDNRIQSTYISIYLFICKSTPLNLVGFGQWYFVFFLPASIPYSINNSNVDLVNLLKNTYMN